MGQPNMSRASKIFEKLTQPTTESDRTMAEFELQILQGLQERQKALKPSAFKSKDDKEETKVQ